MSDEQLDIIKWVNASEDSSISSIVSATSKRLGLKQYRHTRASDLGATGIGQAIPGMQTSHFAPNYTYHQERNLQTDATYHEVPH